MSDYYNALGLVTIGDTDESIDTFKCLERYQ